MPLIEAAFRRAQEEAFRAFDCQAVRDNHAGKDDYERYDRALLAAYLSDPKVLQDFTLALYGSASENDLAAIADALQAIGAEVSP